MAITHNDLLTGMRVSYHDGYESCSAKVISKNDEFQTVRFIDSDDFEWDEPYADIPDTCRRITYSPSGAEKK